MFLICSRNLSDYGSITVRLRFVLLIIVRLWLKEKIWMRFGNVVPDLSSNRNRTVIAETNRNRTVIEAQSNSNLPNFKKIPKALKNLLFYKVFIQNDGLPNRNRTVIEP